MASLESVTIKVELVICHGCLSSDRRLIALSQNTDLFLCLLGRDEVEDPTNISLCWECSAILRNTRRFQQRIQTAQDIMQQSLNQEEHFCLSTLAINETNTYSNTFSVQSYCNNQELETNVRDNIGSDRDILTKQPVVKLETIEVKHENVYDSEVEVDDVDMESVLREKEENLYNITLNRTRSPSSTRDSSITVRPLQKRLKLNNDNEIKTEEETDEMFSSNVGGKEYTTEDYLNVHNLKQNLTTHTIVKPYRCETCNKQFDRPNILKKHHRTHTGEKPYSCQLCDKRFTENGSLKKHIRIHTIEKPYTCETCNKQFIRQDTLKKHLKTHTGEKPYSCELCDNRFTEKGSLIKHLRIHTGEKPYSCELCDKRFIQKSTLKTHLKIHTGDKAYCCEICHKRFHQKVNLESHHRTHTGEKPYRCELCDKRFTEKASLKNHIRIHTGEKPYSCELCNKRFTEKSSLRKHFRTHV